MLWLLLWQARVVGSGRECGCGMGMARWVRMRMKMRMRMNLAWIG